MGEINLVENLVESLGVSDRLPGRFPSLLSYRRPSLSHSARSLSSFSLRKKIQPNDPTVRALVP